MVANASVLKKVDSAQGVIPFEEYATQEQKQEQTPVKEIITYEREKPKNIKAETNFLKISQ